MRFIVFVSAIASAAFAAPVDGDIVRDAAAIDDKGQNAELTPRVKIPECCSPITYAGGSCVSACKRADDGF